jgi:hypothetical protein
MTGRNGTPLTTRGEAVQQLWSKVEALVGPDRAAMLGVIIAIPTVAILVKGAAIIPTLLAAVAVGVALAVIVGEA